MSCTPNPVDNGQSSFCAATANTGYRFSAWSGDCTGTEPSCSLTNITSAKAVTALFEAEAATTHTITTSADPAAGGTVSCTPNPVPDGQNATCTATAHSGYRFSAWSGDCSGISASCTLTNITRAQSVTARFEPDDSLTHAIDIGVHPSTDGAVTCTPNPVPDGASSTCTASANSGFRFVNWYGDCTGTQPNCTLSNVIGPQRLSAHFARNGDAHATHAGPAAYVPGSLVTIDNHFSDPVSAEAITLVWRPQLPPGWIIEGVDGDGIPQFANNEITFAGRLRPPFDIDFRYHVRVPDGDRDSKTLAALTRYRRAQQQEQEQIPAPGTLLLRQHPLTRHSADYREDYWVIDATEYGEVLLYWRAGAYHLDAQRPDGYEAGVGNTNGPRHAADYQDPAWRIDSFEVNRLLAYFRAANYHLEPAGFDGYAPGRPRTTAALVSEGNSIHTLASDSAPHASHSASVSHYTPGGTLRIDNTIGQSGDAPPLSLLWRPQLPTGWTLAPIPENALFDVGPEGDTLVFLSQQLSLPLRFSYEVRIPSDARGPQTLAAQLSYQHLGMDNPAVTAPSPLTLSAAGDTGDHHCDPDPLVLNTPITSGRQDWRSVVGIQVTGAVSVANRAELALTAPRVTFAPGFRVNAGGRLQATSAAVNCPAATQAISASTAAPAPVIARRPGLITSADALPPWLTERLTQLGIDPAALTTALLDAEERWLILATSQALHPADGNALSDIYRLDLLNDRLELISVTAEGAAGNGESRDPAADALGERIVFSSEASDLTPGDDNGLSDLFLRDLALGLTERLTQAEQASAHPALDAHGSALVYDQTTEAGPRRILGQALHDGAGAEVVALSDADARIDAHRPALSADGRYLAYLRQPRQAEANQAPLCEVQIEDLGSGVYHRQPCPGTAAEADAGRVTFSPEGDTLLWHSSGHAQPLMLANPLAEPRP